MTPETSAPRSRRSLLLLAVGGLGALGSSVLGRPGKARAASGDPLTLGATNSAGTSQTILTNAGTGAAFTLRTTNTSPGATGIFGWTSQTGAGATRGVYGKSDGANGHGVFGRQSGVAGSGAAVGAEGNANHGLDASTTSATRNAVRGVTASTSAGATAIRGEVSSTSAGSASAALRGDNKATNANGYGVVGTHAGTGIGVLGNAVGVGVGAGGYAPSGTGVLGTSDSGFGVRGTSGSGPGVWGTSATDYGVYGSSSATGVRGANPSLSASGYGVFGSHAGTGIGVLGNSLGTAVGGYSPGATGVHGVSDSSFGVRGESGSGPGVWGTSSTDYGVYGYSATSHAGYFNGTVHVNGTLSKSAGAFRIDHPLDPANRYLNHSFVESPDMKNVYDGLVRLDAAGAAMIELPGYFDALNRDVRYQLTPIGGPAPDLHVRTEVAKGRFSIAGGRPGQLVSWQLTGIRQDAFAEAHRILVEEPKAARDRGSYLHPELHGAPASLALGRVEAPADRARLVGPGGPG